MPAPLVCPGIECWEAVLTDTIPPGEQEEYERHLELCPACQERLHHAEGCGDALLRLVRRVGDPTVVPADPTLTQFLEQLHEANGLSRSLAAEPADLYFLRPSDRP